MNEEQRLSRIEQELEALQRRLKPAIELYESLIPYGLDRYMLPLIRSFGKQYEAAQNGKEKASIWNFKWTRWAAIIGIFYGCMQISVVILVLYNTLFGIHK